MNATATTSSRTPAASPAAPAAPQAPAVEARKLSLTLDDRPILRQVALNIAGGHTVALLGANGAGKSSLLNVLAMLLHPSGGELRLFGQRARPQAAGLRRRIGVIAHQAMLYRDLSIRENLLFFGRLYDVPDPTRRADELLRLVGLAHRPGDAVKTLSRGLTQRAAIARALMHDPDLLLADEPFDGLDAASAAALREIFAALHIQGKTLIFSHHDVPAALEMADTVVLLRRGRVLLAGPAAATDPAAVRKEICAS